MRVRCLAERQKYRLVAMILFFVLFFMPVAVVGGNKELVDKRVREMDALNREAVGQLPEIPKNGTIELEADVRYENGSVLFDNYRQKTTTHRDGSEALDIPGAAHTATQGAPVNASAGPSE